MRRRRGPAVRSTGGGLVFSDDPSGNLIAVNAADPLWALHLQ
jgi:hypothetical protein